VHFVKNLFLLAFDHNTNLLSQRSHFIGHIPECDFPCQLLYLRQEMEFVKKIMNAGNSPKQGR
jgi:hypothetical protein